MATKILPTHRIVWTLLCIYPVDESVSKWKKWILKLFPLIAFASHLVLMASSLAFFIAFMRIDLEIALSAFGQLFAYFPMIFVIPIGIIRRHKFFAVFKQLDEIHIKCKCSRF